MRELIDKAALLETFDKWIDLGIYSVAELNVMRHARRIVRNAPVCESNDNEDVSCREGKIDGRLSY